MPRARPFPGGAGAERAAPMTPPRLPLLQLFNTLAGAGSYLTFAAASSAWTAGGWGPREVGFAGMATNLCYAGLVAQGGTLSDRWGRARTAILGGALSALGTLLALLGGGPGWACAGVMLAFAGTAFFFPGNVGLFSDARGDGSAADPPLHLKVSRYNLGWAGGNLIGFAGAWLLALLGLPLWVAFLAATAAFAGIAAALWRWRGLPPSPPAPAGDRAGHPALPRLTLMARVAIGIYCCLGMAFIGLLENSLVQDGAEPARAHALAVSGLTAYALGYVATFWQLGRWDGWVLRPWTTMAVQAPVALGALLVLATGLGHWHSTPALLACGAVLGLGFGAVYAPSMYYSLRLPTGAARAASLHETSLGIGSTAGPALAGLFVGWYLSGRTGVGVAALGAWMLLVCAVLFTWQALLIPGARRQGAG